VKVAIAGAGIVGCAIAYELAARGASVRVFDPRGVGRGATHASAGILAPGIEGHSADLRRLLVESFRRYDGFVSRLRAETGCPIEYDRAGTLQVALDDEEVAVLAAEAAGLRADGLSGELLSGSAAAKMEPALGGSVAGALLVREHGYVAVGELLAAVTRAAEAHGATFVVDRVMAVQAGETGARVVTATQTIESDAAIVAAGSWSSEIAGAGLRPAPVRPIRGQILRLRHKPRAASRVIWGRRGYIVPWVDGTVLVGATSEDVGFDERATSGGVQELLNAGLELLPALERATFDEVLVGLRPMTCDELPVIGASSRVPRVFLATGHYRSGILLAPLTASLVADLVLEGREGAELMLTHPARVGL
jgi:glycine oxidase